MTTLALSLALALATPQAADDPFPPSTALAEGVSPESLAALSELVRSFVERDEVVGAELLVIVNGRTILHEGHGWRDRERKVAMQPGGVFCVRSMTKPLIGAATWMLIESGELALDTCAAELLPAFDVEGKRGITVEQLLLHHSGLPMSLIMDRDPRTLKSLREVADLGGGCRLEFAPGTAFRYSDQGTDTLAAMVEESSGVPAGDFVQERLLDPLEMRDTTCLMVEGHPLRERLCSAYVGSPGSWVRYFDAAQPQLFGVFPGSQALYSTAVDYARFLDLYLKGGVAGGERLLSASSVSRTLEPGRFRVPSPSGLPDLRADYGTLMQLWTRAVEGNADARETVVFGHGGSDGTHAWAFPESKAVVLYFTQSRGTTTGTRVEERLGELFLGVPVASEQPAPPMDEYLGYYWEGEGDRYRAIVRDGEELALDTVDKGVFPLDYVGDDRWRMRTERIVLAFDRDESGRVTGYHIGEHVEYRFEPRADLPKAEDLAARIAAAHHIERLADAGVLCLRGRVEFPRLNLQGESELWLAWPGRWRDDETVGKNSGSMAFDGKILRATRGGSPATPIEGRAAELLSSFNPFLRFGDWRRSGATLTVIQELRRRTNSILLMRAGDCSAPAPTLYVDGTTGRLVRMDGLTHLEGVGVVGQRAAFSDWREVGGALLPFRFDVEVANQMIGKYVTTYESFEAGVKVEPGWFELESKDAER